MPGRSQFAIALLSVGLGYLAGAALKPGPDRSAPDGSEKRGSLSALERDPSREIADGLADLMPANIQGGRGGADAWTRLSSMELGEVIRLVKHLDRREWISAADGRVLEMAIERWAMIDDLGALKWIENSARSNATRNTYHRVYRAFANRDLEAAVEYLETVPDRYRNASLHGLARPFAEADPQRAAQYYLELGRKYSWANRQIASVWAWSDPLAAIEFYSGDHRSASVIETVVGEWALADRDAALAWVRGEGIEPGKRYRYLSQIASHLFQTDPLGAMALLDEIPAGWNRNGQMSSLLHRWTDTDPDAAVAWANSLDDPSARANALMQLSQALSRKDPELALELAESLPNAAFRDQAFADYVLAKSDEDPEGTLAWAEELEDDDQRRSAITGSVAGLAKKDIAGATDYIVATEDRSHKKEMFAKIIESELPRDQMENAREVVKKLSKEDEKLAIETIIEVHGDHMPKSLTLLMKTTGSLGTFLDWAEKLEEFGFGY